jgi:hypothetical protein
MNFKEINSMDLPEILISNGYKKSIGYSKRYPKFNNGFASLVCFKAKKSELWRFFHQSDSSLNFSIVDGIKDNLFTILDNSPTHFLPKVNQEHTQEITQEITQEHTQEITQEITQEHTQEIDLKSYEKNLIPIKSYNYRGFELKLKYMYIDNRNNLVFPNWQKNDCLFFDECKWFIVGYTVKNPARFNSVIGKRGLTIHQIGCGNDLIIGENLIDLLAFVELNNLTNAILVATQGNLTANSIELIATLYNGGGNVISAFDNDSNGELYRSKIQALFKNRVIDYIPTHKDFLDDLLALQNKAI